MVGGWDVEGYAILTYNTQIYRFKPRITHTHTLTHEEAHSSKWDNYISPASLGSECMERVEASEPEGESASAGRQCL